MSEQTLCIHKLNVAWDIGDAITTTHACAVASKTPYPLTLGGGGGENTVTVSICHRDGAFYSMVNRGCVPR